VLRYLLILGGGAIGSLTRFLVGTAIVGRMGAAFPYGTVFINITGSFLIGFVMAFLGGRTDLSANWRFLIVVGFLGGYTTFSSFEWETLSLVRSGGGWLALLNAMGSVIAGFAAVWLGATASGRWSP
jgi:fluoride exporter